MRNLERSGQWFTAILIAIFALPVVAVVLSMASSRSFWSNLLPLVGIIIFVSLIRAPLERLGRAPRFVAWLGIGAAAAAVFALTKGEAFSLPIAAFLGLAWGIADLVAEYFRSKREAEFG